MKYTATFSNGQTITRNSEHEYRYAAGLIDSDGKVHNVTFSKTNNPKIDWWGTGVSVGGHGLSNKERTLANRQNEEIKRNWKVEIVKAVQS